MTATQTVSVGDIEVAYRHGPSKSLGSPMVFVHGLGEDSRSWQAQLRYFGRDRPVFAVDVRGHGGTSLGNARGSLGQLADDLVGFLEQVAGFSTCIGFSMGGAIVLAAAAKRPDLVERAVVVCSSSMVGRRAAERFLARADGIDTSGRAFAVNALRANLETVVSSRPIDWSEQVQSRLEAIGDGRGYANGARAMASMQASPLTDRLPDVTSRVDVLVGELDESCPWRAAEIIVGALPNGTAHLLPGVGHFVNIENPEVLSQALRELGLP